MCGAPCMTRGRACRASWSVGPHGSCVHRVHQSTDAELCITFSTRERVAACTCVPASLPAAGRPAPRIAALGTVAARQSPEEVHHRVECRPRNRVERSTRTCRAWGTCACTRRCSLARQRAEHLSLHRGSSVAKVSQHAKAISSFPTPAPPKRVHHPPSTHHRICKMGSCIQCRCRTMGPQKGMSTTTPVEASARSRGGAHARKMPTPAAMQMHEEGGRRHPPSVIRHTR